MEFKTDRLSIKYMEHKDFQDFKQMTIDFRDSEYSIYNPPLPETDMEMRTLFYFYLNCLYTYGIYLNNEMIGIVAIDSDDSQVEIGFMFKNKYKKRGYAYEGTKAVIDLLIKETKDIKIFAGVGSGNTPSVNLLKKLGFECESIEEISFIEDITIEGCNYILNY